LVLSVDLMVVPKLTDATKSLKSLSICIVVELSICQKQLLLYGMFT
jgi:hypothetical protein